MISRKIDEVKRELTNEELITVQNSAIDATIKFVQDLPDIPNYDVADFIANSYSDNIREYILKNYSWVSDDSLDRLIKAVCLAFNKEFFRNGHVGMAFAGFGNLDIFPKCIIYTFLGLSPMVLDILCVSSLQLPKTTL